MLESALVAGICSVGAHAVIAGIVPTPAVAYLIRKFGLDAGVVISASHNPVEYNGIKFFNKDGYKLADELENEIEELLFNDLKGIPSPTGKDSQRSALLKALRPYLSERRRSVIDGMLGMESVAKVLGTLKDT
jgi:phosphoglucosamine mutase